MTMAITRATNVTSTVISAARCCISATRRRRRHETGCPDRWESNEATEEEAAVMVPRSPRRPVRGNCQRARYRGGGRFAQVRKHEFVERDAVGRPAIRDLRRRIDSRDKLSLSTRPLRLDDGEQFGDALRLVSWSAQHHVLGEKIVNHSNHLDPTVAHQDEIVSDSLQFGHDVRGENY